MNSIQIVGNLTKDVESRQTSNNKTVCNLSIAVNRPFSDQTDFFNAVVWDKQADNCIKYLKKGSKVGIVGYLYNRSYEGNDGVKRTVTEINAINIEFLSSKPSDKEEVTSIKRERPVMVEINDNNLPF